MAGGIVLISLAGLLGSALLAAHGENPDASTEQSKVCQMVVGAQPGAKPYRLCMSKTEWDAKKALDAKDANRIVCHYQDRPGTRFRSAKVCMSAAEWTNERLRNRQAVEQIQMRSCVPGGGC